MPVQPLHEQGDQPDGVPPLALTGERTLPDIPAENYWFRRHLAVYEWIAARISGLRVIDMACGEGYGANLLARSGATSVIGVDANPEAHEHARLRYRAANLSFARDLIETFTPSAPVQAIVFLQTIEHLQDPAAVLTHFRALLAGADGEGVGGGRAREAEGVDEGADQAWTADHAGGEGRAGVSCRAGASCRAGVVFVSTPNVLTLAPPGAPRSDNPWHVHEYRAEEFAGLCREVFPQVELYGLYHARKLRLHELALRAGWDSVHPRLRLTERFYGRFTPAIAASDFALRPAGQADLDRALDFLAVCRP